MNIVSTSNGGEAADTDHSIDCQIVLSMNDNNELSDIAGVRIDT